MLIIAEVLKFIGVFLSTAAAIYATKTDGLTSSKLGKLTKHGWNIIIFALAGLMIAGGAQLFQIYDVVESTKKNQERQELLTSRLESIIYQSVRQHYPLEPISIVYELEYPMDQHSLSSYANEVQAKIVSWLRESRESRRETRDDLGDEDLLFVISNRNQWLPTKRVPVHNLLSDSTSFSFRMSENDPDIKFVSARSGEEKIFVSLPIKGIPAQKITVFADFQNRVFVKEVTSENPLRMGKDLFAISALDLIGRKMTWDSSSSSIVPEEANADWRLRKIAFVFPYDYEQGSTSRRINSTRTFEVPADTDYVIIKPEHLGLDNITEISDALRLKQ